MRRRSFLRTAASLAAAPWLPLPEGLVARSLEPDLRLVLRGGRWFDGAAWRSDDVGVDAGGRLDASAIAPGVDASLRATLPPTPDGPAQADPLAPLTFQANATVEALAPYAPLVARFAPGLSPAGAAEVGVSGTAQRDASTFDVGLRVETEGLSLGLARLDPLLAGTGLVTARVARTDPADLSGPLEDDRRPADASQRQCR